MKKFIIPLVVAVVVVSVAFAGCVPGAPPVTPPVEPVTPPVEPVTPPVEPVTPPVEPPAPLPENPYEGLAIKPDGTPYQFANALYFVGNEWAVTIRNICDSRTKMAGGIMTNYNPAGDLVKQIDILVDLLTIKPDAVLLHPVDSDAVVPQVEALVAAGIPVFTHDIDANTEAVTSYVTHDQELLGATAGMRLVELQRELGEPIVVYEPWGAYETSIAQMRSAGFRSALEGYPIEVIKGADCSWSAAEATNAVMDVFPAMPELNAFYDMGCMGVGCIEGLRAIDQLYPAGDPRHVFGVCVDETSDLLPLVGQGYIDGIASHCPYKENEILMKVVFTYVCLGRPAPHKIVLGSYTITKENYTDPKLFGNIIASGVSWDDMPVLEFPPEMIGGLVTPTAAMKLPGY